MKVIDESLRLRGSGYSLWLGPDPDTSEYVMLDQIIQRVAGIYGTPLFKPHVTLLGGIKGDEEYIRKKTRAIAAKIAPYDIELGELGSNGTASQILFSRVEKRGPVLAAYDIAQKEFELDKGPYFPHLSFVYNQLTPVQVSEIWKMVAGEGELITTMCFKVSSISLWQTKGVVEEWREVEKCPFKKA